MKYYQKYQTKTSTQRYPNLDHQSCLTKQLLARCGSGGLPTTLPPFALHPTATYGTYGTMLLKASPKSCPSDVSPLAMQKTVGSILAHPTTAVLKTTRDLHLPTSSNPGIPLLFCWNSTGGTTQSFKRSCWTKSLGKNNRKQKYSSVNPRRDSPPLGFLKPFPHTKRPHAHL